MAPQRPHLVLGGSGLLGEALTEELRRRRQLFVAPTREEVDLLDAAELERKLGALKPMAVINASAFSDVNRAELPECRSEVFRLNRELPGRVALICRRLEIPMVHVSTDYVFDGKKRAPYVETDPVHPLQVYGESKLAGEVAVRQAHPGALVVRTSTIYGPGRRKRPHYVDAILRQAREKGTLEVVRLPTSSPTYSPDLAAALLELLATGASGLVHAVNRGECTRHELAQTAVRLDGHVDLVVGERPEPEGALARPDYSVLDSGYLESLLGRPMRPWTEALREYLQGAS